MTLTTDATSDRILCVHSLEVFSTDTWIAFIETAIPNEMPRATIVNV